MNESYRSAGARLAARADELWDVERRVITMVGERVQQLREAQGLRLVDLQERSGVTYRRIILIEEGKTNATMRTLARIAHGLGVPPQALFDEAPKSGLRRKK